MKFESLGQMSSKVKMKVLKNFTLTVLSLVVISCASAQKTTKNTPPTTSGYSISGTIKYLKDTTCLLAYYSGEKRLVQDSAQVDSKGNFSFKGDKNLPGGIYMLSFPTPLGSKALEFLVGEQNIEIYTDTTNSIDNVTIKNSKENEIYYNNLKFERPLRLRIAEIQDEIKDLDTESNKYKKLLKEGQEIEKEIKDHQDEIRKTYPESFLTTLLKSADAVVVPKNNDSTKALSYLQEHYFDNIDFSDSRLARTPILVGKYDYYLTKLTYQEPDSIIKSVDFILKKAMADSAVFKLTLSEIGTKYEKSKIMCMDKVMLHIFQLYYKKGYAWWANDKTIHEIDKWITRHAWVQCGNQPPKLNFPDTNGVKHELFDLQAKYTLVYFWSATCGHCKKMTPKVWELYEKYNKKGFEVYAVCIDNSDEPYKTFLKKHGLNWTNVRDGNNTGYYRNKYDVFSTPRMYLLDSSKRIKLKHFGFEVLQEFLEDELMAD